MAVSIRVVSHSTNRMKDPSSMTPGIKSRLEARTRMTMRKRIVRPAVMIANGNSLKMLASSHLQGRGSRIPWYADSQLILHCYEPSVDSKHCCCSSENNKNPKVELYFWPPIPPPRLANDDVCARHEDAASCKGALPSHQKSIRGSKAVRC